jgi:(heptosyl)LPS beta-1,4-glucosyltransferase
MSEQLRNLVASGRLHCRQSFDRQLCWDDDLPPALVERIWRNPHGLLSEGVKLQDKPRCTVVRLEDEAGTFVWKHHNWGTVRRTMKRSLFPSTARKTWSDGVFLSEHGVPTPRPRAFLERRLGPFQRFSYVLSDYVPGTSLYRLMRFERPSRDMVLSLADQVAAIWQQLDDLCVWHNDFKTENLLVDPAGKVWLIDLERTRRYRDRDRMRRRQSRDAADLLHPRNWRANPTAAEAFREAILRTPAAQATMAAVGDQGHPLSRPVAKNNRATHLVTVLIPTRNSAETILPCLESVRDMADEIIVADSGSTDETVHLVRQTGCRLLEKDCDDPAAFEAWATSHARHSWILRLLPSEVLNPDLGRQVQDILATDPAEDGFMISRSVHFRGRRLNYGDFQREASLRLYRKDLARIEMRGGHVRVNLASERIGSLRAKLFYEACVNVQQYFHELLLIAERAAKEANNKGDQPKRLNVLWKAPWQFVRSYFLRRGMLDGWAGLHASCLSAFGVCLQEAMLWSFQRPALGRHATNREVWSPLKVFDPAGMAAEEWPPGSERARDRNEEYIAPPSRAAA